MARNRAPPRRFPRRPPPRGRFIVDALLLWALVAVLTWGLMPQLASRYRQATATPEQLAAAEAQAYYPNCDAARAAGAAPIYRGSPGYREGLDGDADGIACEPYRH